ncbi:MULTISPECIES: Rieske 2Fe-2S domain-containing protein [unclassified Pseudomonas]|uniref:Rieske (2Fe-2S) protein n=1 Tax=Pseudomonas TaxID=286 RepID=UPI0008712C69|nr:MULTISPECIES: Rieske 2Fe-2S domain-containing protein [unclassified Pseudomonas]SCW99123.1 Ferredoxin subunit of nitrite reductase or a ring-hydroxylating dioxygenase [Pseudomonas sp. NFACC56-3]SFK88170.1 Ferredoxin subunit of nitrite reductase or a ring-hydroxylating dioxygenase [Pseudomonas sp. NFACC52]
MDFEKTVARSALPEGGKVVVEVRGHSILLCRLQGQVLAVQNRCTHAGSRLDSGLIAEGSIRCPLHGVRFDLHTGQCLNVRLGCAPLKCFATRETGDHIEVEVIEH